MVESELKVIPLAALRAHPLNCNAMAGGMFKKLVGHIGRTGRYPPVVVRAVGDVGEYQILDGHHRVRALKELGRVSARCVVWEVDDREAMVLLGTLNRLAGRDDARKRAGLVAALAEEIELPALAEMLPEGLKALEGMRDVVEEAGEVCQPRPVGELPVAVHFFLLPDERGELEGRLKDVGGTREAALMRLVRGER